MKLKYININGYGVLVDESAEIKHDDFYLDLDTNIIYYLVTKPNGNAAKIIFAEKELNLDVPVLPNWREWEVEQEALYFLELQPKQILTKDKEIGLLTGFIAGYNHNKAKYTEEDLKEALFAALNHDKEECCVTHTRDSIVRSVIQSLQKYPKYVVMENEQTWEDFKNGDYQIERPKLITNSEGKQEGIIKELIWN